VLRYYWRVLRTLPGLLLTSTSRVNGIVFLLALLAAVAPTLTARWSTAKQVRAYAASFPLWWPLVPIGLLALFGLLKANYEFYAKVERQRNRLRAKLDDRVKRHQDADELGRLRKTMRKRYYEWIGVQSVADRASGKFAAAYGRGLDLQNQIAALLERRYGFDIRDRFLTADDSDSEHPFGLIETKEYAGRIKRLRGIIREIRSGKIRRKVT
jgi:hypothetical protein